jgi:hypothetical protein
LRKKSKRIRRFENWKGRSRIAFMCKHMLLKWKFWCITQFLLLLRGDPVPSLYSRRKLDISLENYFQIVFRLHFSNFQEAVIPTLYQLSQSFGKDENLLTLFLGANMTLTIGIAAASSTVSLWSSLNAYWLCLTHFA